MRTPGFPQTDDHPVVCVSWNDAVAFCEWLSSKEKRRYRLPTEAEWEYACRAGTRTYFWCGDDPEALPQVGNVADASLKEKFANYSYAIHGRDGYTFTSPVEAFAPNPFGLYDMHGNACQWCADWFDADYYHNSPLTDPTGPKQGTKRVARGGSFVSLISHDRSAYREAAEPDLRHIRNWLSRRCRLAKWK